MASIGIDFGLNDCKIAVLRNIAQLIENKGRQTTPSVVTWDDGDLLVGKAAKDLAMILPSVRSVKRHMGTDKTFTLGDKTYTPVDISAMILAELKKAAEEKLEEPVNTAVITIPAYFSGAQKEATKKAGEQAGFQTVRLLAEPIAAALAYGTDQTALVYDLRGGTFDVAIIDRYDMIALDGDNYLGGEDFGNRLGAHLTGEVKNKTGLDIESDPEAMQLAKAECERAKIDLSERQHTRIRFQTRISGKAVNVILKITREEFEEMIMDLVDSTIEKVARVNAKAGDKQESFSKKDIEAVILVGRSTYVPLVQRKLTEYFGMELSKKVNPEFAVALGAARCTLRPYYER